LIVTDNQSEQLLGAYGNQDIKTPNIDALAERGVVFERAYCQAAQCGPSRVSFMTGLRPETTRVFSLRDRFKYEKREPQESLTMGRHLIAFGYSTRALGKIYHDGRDDDRCWSEAASPGRAGEILEIVPDGGGATVIADREKCPAWQSPAVEDEASMRFSLK
jgi:arylsulfatase A-like enzyme